MGSVDTTLPYFVHPSALVDAGARIGRDSRIWAFAHVMAGAVMGEKCSVGEHVFVESGAKLGNNVTIKNCVQVWEGIIAEDGVFLGPNAVLTNDLYPRSFPKRPKNEWLKSTLLREGCTIGANATVICGNTVGRYAFVAAGAVVTNDVQDFCLVVGVPARFSSWICRCGERLTMKLKRAQCRKCGDRYEVTSDGFLKLLGAQP